MTLHMNMKKRRKHSDSLRRFFLAGAVLLSAGALSACGSGEAAPNESTTAAPPVVLMEETLPQTAADETVMALTPDGPLLPSVAGVDAEYTDPIPDYLRIGEHHPIVAKLQQRLMDLGFMDNDEPTDFYGEVTQSAVKIYQRQNKLAQDSGSSVSDGVSGLWKSGDRQFRRGHRGSCKEDAERQRTGAGR